MPQAGVVTRVLLAMGTLAGLSLLECPSGAPALGAASVPPAPAPPASAVPTACPPGQWAVDGTCADAQAVLAPNGTLYWVDAGDPRASDANSGTAQAPWRTIARAARTLRPGDAVQIRAGVYRESVEPVRGGTGPEHRITYAAAPGERVVVTGADPVEAGWTPAGPGRWRRRWTFPALPAYSDEAVFRRELVSARGVVLRPVASTALLVPGSVVVEGPDTAPVALTVSLPPHVRPDEVEIGTRPRLFWPVARRPDAPCGDASQAAWLRVVGLTFVHAANRAQWGAVCAGSAHGLWEDVTVAWSIGMGVDGSGTRHVFRRVASDDHGQMGWGAQCTGCLFEDTAARRNNWRGHDPFWEAGGGKWVRTSDTVLRRHTATDNRGPGIWLDGDNARNTIEGCRAARNDVAGVMLELNTVETLVQHCHITETRWRAWSGSGILSQAASRNVLLHNTLVGNDGMGLWLRLDPLRRAPDRDQHVEANWIAGNAVATRQGGPADEAREIAAEAASLAHRRTYTFVSNVYGRPAGDPTLVSTFFLAPTGPGVDYRGSSLGIWAGLTGEADARWASDGPVPLARRRPIPSAGAREGPPQRWTHVGADPARLAGGARPAR